MKPLGSIAAALAGVVVEDAHAEVRGPASPGSAHRDRGPADFRGNHSGALHPLPVRAVSPPPKAGSLAWLSRLRRILEKTITHKIVNPEQASSWKQFWGHVASINYRCLSRGGIMKSWAGCLAGMAKR